MPEAFGGYPELGVAYWGRYNKDYSMLGSILGSPYVGKLNFLGCWQAAYIQLPEYRGGDMFNNSASLYW